MTDEALLQATLLALTRQNITGDPGGKSGAIIDDYAIRTDGWIEEISPIMGDYVS